MNTINELTLTPYQKYTPGDSGICPHCHEDYANIAFHVCRTFEMEELGLTEIIAHEERRLLGMGDAALRRHCVRLVRDLAANHILSIPQRVRSRVTGTTKTS